ncbi:MAG: hypothetical protein ACFFBI_09370 [Promethearchaeota archaeon]
MLFDYISEVEDAIEFLVALGSIIGFLGLVVGIIGWLTIGQFKRYKMIGVIIASIILLVLCGTHTGFKYFHINY